jgi:hypothetical protein
MQTNSGSMGEFRMYICDGCGTRFEKFFCHFELPEKFSVMKCAMCYGSAHLNSATQEKQAAASQILS